LPLLPQFLLL
jgi:hypothetical protein